MKRSEIQELRYSATLTQIIYEPPRSLFLVQDGFRRQSSTACTRIRSPDIVVNGERKSFGKRAMIAENSWMNAGEKEQRVDVSEEAVQEIRPDADLYLFIKAEPLDQILLSFVENLDSHRDFLRIFVLADSQSSNRALPSATLWRRSTRTSSCQAGDSTTSGERLKSSQSSSIATSLSCNDISFSGKLTDIR